MWWKTIKHKRKYSLNAYLHFIYYGIPTLSSSWPSITGLRDHTHLTPHTPQESPGRVISPTFTWKTQPSEDTNFRTQNTSKRAAADTRGWQLNNIVNYPLVLSATGVIRIMLNLSLSKLNLTTKPNVPGAEVGHTIPNSNADDSNKNNNSKSNYNNIK
jgi:hypothetical protein